MGKSLLRWSGLLLVALAGCTTHTTLTPSLTTSPSGTVVVHGTIKITATAVATGGAVSWSLNGPGSLSGTSGASVVYVAPAAPPPGGSAVVTATSGSLSARVTLSLSPVAYTSARIAGLSGDVDVSYDAWQVPHIRCAQANDCYAVQGYLQAKDRLFQMDFLRRVATGRLASLVGTLGLSQDVQLRTIFTTRAGEPLGVALARNLATGDPAGTNTLTAYVGGINARLAELRAASTAPLGDEYAQLPFPITAQDVPDWTLADVLTFVRLQQYSLSSTLEEELDNGRFAAVYAADPKLGVYLRTQQPSTEQTFTLQPSKAPAPLPRLATGARQAQSAAPPALAGWKGALDASTISLSQVRALLRPLDGSTGSNNWVVAAGNSVSGLAMVANDPHLSLQYPPNFHLSAMTSTRASDHLDVTGGAFPGTPGAQVGRGQHVGWGVTVVGYDVTDVYLEQAVPAAACPPSPPINTAFCVSFPPAATGTVAVLAYPTTYQVRVAAGTNGLIDAQSLPADLRPPAVVAVVPHHGPIIQAPDATTGKAISFRWTGHEDNTNDLKAFLGLNTAQDVDEAMAALKFYATGAQNFVLADDGTKDPLGKSHIAYDPHALVPVRTFASAAAMLSGGAIPVHPPWFPLPSDGTAEWGSGVAADNCAASGASEPAAACWIPDAQLPQGKDPAAGFFATANADPLGTSNSPFPVPVDATYGNYLSFSWDDSTAFRHARVTERLQALTAGGGKVSEADMESIQADHVSRFGAAFQRQIALLTPAAGSDLALAQGMMAAWKTNGFDCPSGLDGIDPALSPESTDATVKTNSAACYLFHQFVRTLLPAVFDDELAATGASMNGVMAIKAMLHMLENPTTADQSLCSDVDATGTVVVTPHTCVEQLSTALATAFATLSASLGDPTSAAWTWGRVHTFQPVSQFPTVTLGFEPGPFARPGGAFTVDVGTPSLTATGTSFAFRSSANVRHVSVMDPDPAAAVVRMQLPGPERSGPYGVIVGPDLLVDWAGNTYFDYAHGPQIQTSTVATQRFTP